MAFPIDKLQFILLIFSTLSVYCFIYSFTAIEAPTIVQLNLTRIQTDVPVFALATSTLYGFCSTAESALENGRSLNILGLNEDFSAVEDRKTLKTGMFLNATDFVISKFGPDHIVMFTDGFDVLFQQPPSYFLNKYQHFHGQIVYSAENNFWPPKGGVPNHQNPLYIKQQQMFSEMPDVYAGKGDPVQFLNSGAVIGKAGELRKWFEDSIQIMASDHINDDQELATTMLVSGKYNATLDVRSSMFFSMNGALNLLEQDPNTFLFKNAVTQQIPGAIHFNGDKSPFPTIAKSLWFKKANYSSPARKIGFHLPLKNNAFVRLSDVC